MKRARRQVISLKNHQEDVSNPTQYIQDSLCIIHFRRSKRNVATVHGPLHLSVYSVRFHCGTTIRCQLGGAEATIRWCACIKAKKVASGDCGGVTAVVEAFVR